MSFFDVMTDIESGLSVTLGGETYKDILTTIGQSVGGVWSIVGEVADELTSDVNLNLNQYWKDLTL
ncbi:hypothetical protein [Aliarcobacter butzleri]|uniref:hypothetical protein n=1 Tax=Aliarcobacter butzleri TaxID=28197 RepID=UPI00062E4B2A|nr:hypothetical protein [Aliarcobacter butzleri]KLD98299.1 hypothetical protein AF74_03530 [Aliarcobacter butzleri L349]